MDLADRYKTKVPRVLSYNISHEKEGLLLNKNSKKIRISFQLFNELPLWVERSWVTFQKFQKLRQLQHKVFCFLAVLIEFTTTYDGFHNYNYLRWSCTPIIASCCPKNSLSRRVCRITKPSNIPWSMIHNERLGWWNHYRINIKVAHNLDRT